MTKKTSSRSGAHADAPTGKRREAARDRSRRDDGSNPSPLPTVSRDTNPTEKFTKTAIGLVGYPYRWGTQGPRTFDCSGLVQWCYRVATGKTITPSSYAQFRLGKPVARRSIQRGDLVFWDTERNGTAGHVGIAISNARVVSAFNESRGVIESDISANYGGPFLGARRLFGNERHDAAPDPDRVTPDSPFRDTGNTDFDSFRHALARSVTPGRTPPPLVEAEAIYAALEPRGLTRLAAGMAWIERSNDTNDDDLRFYGRDLHNLWAVKEPSGSWARYRDYAQAARAWADRILGPTYADLTTIAEFIGRYAPWSDGNDPVRYGTRLAGEVSALARVADPDPNPDDPDPEDPSPGSDLRSWEIPGYPRAWWLPKDIVVEIRLSPIGVHRPGDHINVTGSTLHETGNRGLGKGARMHSQWQDNCTPDHPDGYVGVGMYVENRLVIVKIPGDESSIHSGDWRNHAHPSMEVCVNADRNAELTEDTAMWVQANILLSRDQNAEESLYPHTQSGCPAIINGQGRWPVIVRGVDERIASIRSGNPVPPPESYAVVVPVPHEWDGTDYVRPSDGGVFVALSRVFVTTTKTAARQSANPRAPKVRRDLNAGEAFLSHYVVRGSDGKPWFVSKFGSRIAAADCAPPLDSFADAASLSLAAPIVNEPRSGLDAQVDPSA